MNYNVKLGRISGIDIGLHYSWFIIAALIVFSLGEHFRRRLLRHRHRTIVRAASACDGQQ